MNNTAHLKTITKKIDIRPQQQEVKVKVKRQRHSNKYLAYYDPIKQQWIWRD